MKPIIAGIIVAMLAGQASAACCYFSAKDKDVSQPAQKSFITYNSEKKLETFTVQPKFEGNAADFGMVIPTPARPKLDEMPREFFKELAVFTILEPMDMTKYKPLYPMLSPMTRNGAENLKKDTVKVLEAGVVGSLDYKIIVAEQADDLFQWLKDNNYSYAGDQKTLDFYIQKKWFFTVMKIDPKQMKKNDDGTYTGEITPTQFAFSSEKIIYPAKITQISVKNSTEALFYIQADHKVDLPGDMSYQFTFIPMWNQALSFAIKDKVTKEESAWQENVKDLAGKYTQKVGEMRQKKHEPATLEWAKKITDKDVNILSGEEKYNRDAPKEDVEKLKLLKGHIQKGQFITKMRKVFAKDELTDDLEFVRAKVNDKNDDIEHFSILPTSPP